MKDTGKKFLVSKGRLIELEFPAVMGILNATPDSFFESSRELKAEGAVKKAAQMIDEGAAILDIGGYSSRPGASDISIQEEADRVLPVIESIRQNFPQTLISIDTFRSEIAELAVNSGADIVNDISGGNLDKKMFETVARLKTPYILMHMQGNPQTMQNAPEYLNVVDEIVANFSEKLGELNDLGVHDIILDPGFGFGKTVDHNYELLRRLQEFEIFNSLILAGVSRKSIVNKVLNTKTEEALNGTTALHMECLKNGASILRVHDVKPAVEAVKIHKFVRPR
ncbi:dihydropteroate synthase [Halocola ammonii]